LVVGASTVEAVEVEARGAKVDCGRGVDFCLQGAGGIEGKVVVDELAEVGVAGSDAKSLAVRECVVVFVLEVLINDGVVGIRPVPLHRLSEGSKNFAG
jgi:hypothetical protein